MGKLIAALVGVVVAGGPMVFFIWHEVSEALLGRPDQGRLGVAAVLLVLLLILLQRFGRFLTQLE
jgi:hypothetical protein